MPYPFVGCAKGGFPVPNSACPIASPAHTLSHLGELRLATLFAMAHSSSLTPPSSPVCPVPQSETPSSSVSFPLVSVIIPIYNGEAELPELLACLEAQTYPRDRVEYLLVDNNSSDRTAELIQAAIAAQSNASSVLSLHYLCEAEIQSSYAARNLGIRQGRGDILAFTDADCRPQDHWLMDLISPFEDGSVGLVAGEIIGAPGQSFLERYATYMDVLSQKHTLQHAFGPYGQTANLAVRRTAFEEVGLFRPFLTTGGDADMCWRIQASKQWQLRLAETALVAHCHRTTWQDLRSQWQRYGRSNCYLNQLHGISLMAQPSLQEMGMTLLRWLLKEVPRTLLKIVRRQERAIALLVLPISLYCNWFRYQGQVNASFPETAARIEWLESSAS